MITRGKMLLLVRLDDASGGAQRAHTTVYYIGKPVFFFFYFAACACIFICVCVLCVYYAVRFIALLCTQNNDFILYIYKVVTLYMTLFTLVVSYERWEVWTHMHCSTSAFIFVDVLNANENKLISVRFEHRF